MKRRVFFLGRGYEYARFVTVKADTKASALQAAEQWYNSTSQAFSYMELEVDKYPA